MKRIVQTLSLAAGVVALAHCSGNSLLEDGDPSLSGPVAALAVATTHHLHDGGTLEADEAGTKSLENDLGYVVVLEEAAVNWKRLKLVSSGDDPECEGGNDQTLELDRSQSFLDEDLLAHVLAEREIPRVSYCTWELTLAPGTAHATLKNHEGHDHDGGHEPIGETFHLAGTWSRGEASGEFHIHSTEPLTLVGVFQSGHGGEKSDHPLHYHEGEVEKQVTFGVVYDLLLEGLDFSVQDEEALAAQVRANLGLAVHQHLGSTLGH